MDKLEMCRQLPVQAPEEVWEYAFRDLFHDLGGNNTIYKRVNMESFPEIKRLMAPEDFDAYYAGRKSHWMAECTCMACDNTWHTTWGGGPLKSIFVISGEDGTIYPCYPDDSPEDGTTIEVKSNDGLLCPICNEGTTLLHISRLRSGFVRRRLIMAVGNVGSYTTIFYWLAHRRLEADGDDFRSVDPWNAYVLDEKGKINRFHYSSAGWSYSRANNDAFYSKYVTGDGDIYNMAYGGYVCNYVPSQIGYTGEKTGLAEYVRKGGTMPLLYLKTWQKKPNIENLVNAGWSKMLKNMIEKEAEQESNVAILPGVDLTKRKPHEMLGIDRVSFREICRRDGTGWSAECYEAWKTYKLCGGAVDASEFDRYWKTYTSYGVNTVVEAMPVYHVDFPQIDRYMKKQMLSRTEVRLLTDTWRMTGILYGRTELSHEEMWPKNLLRKHDELTALNLKENDKDSWAKYLAGFKMIQEKYGELQWTDGDLCIRLPANNGDLIREGDVLRHCVGTYGNSHVNESSVIFFVRRYRRPERPYYTLAINMKGEPRESQLHGYGNERHGKNKEHSHKIPAKVREFCDRWEKEILMEWYKDQQKKMKGVKIA